MDSDKYEKKKLFCLAKLNMIGGNIEYSDILIVSKRLGISIR